MPTTFAGARERFDAIVFDLFGVVIAFDDALVTRRLAEHCADPRSACLALRDIVSDAELIRGKVSLSEFHSRLVDRHGLSLDLNAFEKLWQMPYSESMPGMRELLQDLAGRTRIVLLSNVDQHYWRTIRDRHDELEYFDRLVLSWEVGRAKPEPEVFEIAAEAAGTEARRCYFVDDKAENVKAAALMGMRSHLFGGVARLREDLSREWTI